MCKSLISSFLGSKCDRLKVRYEIVISRSSSHHHSDELFVVDVTVAIDVCFSDHFVNLLVSQFFSKVSHHVSQFGS